MDRPRPVSVHPAYGTVCSDYCGALIATSRPAVSIDADRIGFGNLTYYCTQIGNPHPRLRGVPVWAFKS